MMKISEDRQAVEDTGITPEMTRAGAKIIELGDYRGGIRSRVESESGVWIGGEILASLERALNYSLPCS